MPDEDAHFGFRISERKNECNGAVANSSLVEINVLFFVKRYALERVLKCVLLVGSRPTEMEKRVANARFRMESCCLLELSKRNGVQFSTCEEEKERKVEKRKERKG